MVPKKLRLQVCVCVLLKLLDKAKESPKVSVGLLAKGSEMQLHNLPPCQMEYMALGEKDVFIKKSPLLSFYAR